MSTITSVTFSPPVAAPGDPVTMTVTGNWEQADIVTVSTPDGASGSGTLEVLFPVKPDDATGRTWTPVSNSGIQAVFSGVA
jgi:hypothetical protein